MPHALQDRALKLHDALDDMIEATEALARELAELPTQDRLQERRTQQVASAANLLHQAKAELFRAGKE